MTAAGETRIGDFILDPEHNELRRGAAAQRLEPKVIEVLQHLAKQPGRVVSREDLLAAVWPGVVVGDDVLTQAIIKLRRALGDDAHKPSYIETISKRGYRLIAAVSGVPSPPRVSAISTEVAPRRAMALMLGGFMAAIAIAWVASPAGLARMPWPIGPDTRGAATASVPIVAVLPLANSTGDASRDYFSDGVTEDIIVALGRFSGLRVISRTAVQSFKGKAVPISVVREQLGARYIVQGSAREGSGKMRVAIELSDAEKGVVLWAQQFDGEGAEVFAIEDRIVRSIVGALHVRLTRLEMERAFAKPTESLEAYDLVLRARELAARRDRRSNREARELLSRASTLAPDYGEIHVAMGIAELDRALFGWVEDPLASARKAEELANKALASTDTRVHARAHHLMSRVHSNLARPELALASAEKAVALNPGDSDLLYWHGVSLLYIGRVEQGVAVMEEARKLDPLLSDGNGINLVSGYYTAGRYREAVALVDQFLVRHPGDISAHSFRAAALARLGDEEKARQAADEVRRLNPSFKREFFGLRYANPTHREAVQEGLRKAGL